MNQWGIFGAAESQSWREVYIPVEVVSSSFPFWLPWKFFLKVNWGGCTLDWISEVISWYVVFWYQDSRKSFLMLA